MTAAEHISRLQEHVAKNADTINHYLEIARTQCEITKDVLWTAINEEAGELPRARGRVVVIRANQGSPADILEKLRAALKTPGACHVAFDPENLNIYVTISS